MQALDPTAGRPVETPYGPAVMVPLTFLCKRSLALLCASRVLARLGTAATCGHVMREAEALEGKCRFAHDLATKVLREVRQKGAAAGPNW